MVAFIFEVAAAINFAVATYYHVTNADDIMQWLFYLLSSVTMVLMSLKYDKEQ